MGHSAVMIRSNRRERSMKSVSSVCGGLKRRFQVKRFGSKLRLLSADAAVFFSFLLLIKGHSKRRADKV